MTGRIQINQQVSRMRETIAAALRDAESGRDSECRALLRLINAAIIDRDSVTGSHRSANGISDQEIVIMLNGMKQQRLLSTKRYDEQGHIDLANRERREITIIDSLLPRMLTSEEVIAAVDNTIKEIGAKSIRDKGRVLGVLKNRYRNQIEFEKIGQLVVERLC